LRSTLCVGEGDGDEHHQSKQGPAGGHGGWPANARGPAAQSHSAQGFPREDPRPGRGQATVDQPCFGPPFYSGESLAADVQ